jgi:uncharacterized membrane protein YGL010W
MADMTVAQIRSLIIKHKRWDLIFGIVGILALMVGVLTFYWRLSRPLGAAMIALFVALALITHFAYDALGPARLLELAAVVFVLAWIGQFVGHKIEGARPSFLTDLVYLLIGPAWLVGKVMRRAGIAY